MSDSLMHIKDSIAARFTVLLPGLCELVRSNVKTTQSPGPGRTHQTLSGREMMTAVFARTVTPNSGHLDENVQFAKKRLAAIKDYCGLDVELRVRMGGPAGQILMVSTHDNVGEIEDIRRKIMEGTASGAIPQPKPGMASSVEDAIWLKI